ncbi:hypothetical protein SBP02_07230 [Pseudomonas benzenivorans]|uniref:ApeA N-terminal domain-containing protein n=1 Tax=Pseudomonas benzenivorans TaxID=556533 RepID=A0ABZ0PZ79_9PSED|nr:hypothetical protein [Pseudomonas benzenivorans]WPC06538.1 hypothetical protein SBP02_07230 [Pseudomonas benzenivorans]
MRTKDTFPLFANGVEYSVEADMDGVVTFISLTYQANDPSLWPTITQNPEPGITANIVMRSPSLERAQETIRTAEGVLSFFGLEQIAWGNPEEVYLPETEEEKRKLSVYSMAHSAKKVTILETEPISFDIIGRTLLRADNVSDYEIPLAFFRKGKNDTYENRHIEACLDFLFMLETLFANGKFKTSQVITEYTSSKPLLDAIYSVTENKDLPKIALHRGHSHHKRLSEKYLTRSPTQIAKSFVELRGVLHHHSLKDKNRWHPERHDDFLADALFLEYVCFRVGFDLFSNEVFSKESETEFLDNYKAAKNSGAHT